MSDAVALARRYLEQHRRLYGDRLVLDRPLPDMGEEVPSPAKGESEPLLNSGELLNDHSDDQVSALEEFRQQIRECRKCVLGDTRNRFVFGVGNPAADLVFVGEAPGYEEDRLGEPFVGRAGRLLDRILAAIDLTRGDVYICNVLKCRPPDNRNPLASEVEMCEPYLQEQLRIIQPKLIVALGRVAAKTLLRLEDTLKNMRQNVYSYAGVELRVTYHTAALLRNPSLKAPAWEDFQKIRDRYREVTGRPPVEA